ncbi:hypothetical protein [Kitasatospora nipponensis]|uniref:hypothetical protein n=1 Tax=Kitasatospora nipponensis TaxID=258049 RepID=UPI0031D9F301
MSQPAVPRPAAPEPGSRAWLTGVLSRPPVSSALLGCWALWALIAFGQAVVYTPRSGQGEPDYMPLLTFCWLSLGVVVAQAAGVWFPTDQDAPMDAAQALAAARRRAVRQAVGAGWFYGLGVATALSAVDLGGATRAEVCLRVAELAARAGALAAAAAVMRSDWFARRHPRLSRVLTGRFLRRRPRQRPER